VWRSNGLTIGIVSIILVDGPLGSPELQHEPSLSRVGPNIIAFSATESTGDALDFVG